MARYSLNKNKYLLDPEYDHLELTLARYKFQDMRNCLALYIGLKTGARAQEILNIKKSDINPYDQSVFITGLKGSDDREIPIDPVLFEDLDLYTRKMNPDDFVFPISYHRLRQIWVDYRPVKKKFHCLRHTFAIRLYKKTKDIKLLQMALGHRNITNTIIYADFVYSQTELRRLIL
jgi:integrase